MWHSQVGGLTIRYRNSKPLKAERWEEGGTEGKRQRNPPKRAEVTEEKKKKEKKKKEKEKKEDKAEGEKPENDKAEAEKEKQEAGKEKPEAEQEEPVTNKDEAKKKKKQANKNKRQKDDKETEGTKKKRRKVERETLTEEEAKQKEVELKKIEDDTAKKAQQREKERLDKEQKDREAQEEKDRQDKEREEKNRKTERREKREKEEKEKERAEALRELNDETPPKKEGAATATGTVLHYRNATTGKRESYAVLESLISRNLKNLVIKPRSTLISREKEVPGCKLSRQFLNSGSNDITDLSKSVLIQRIVQDKTTGKVFAQYQIASLSVLDPEMSKEAKATMTSEKWNTEITQDLQLMAGENTPTEQLPVVYDFVWMGDQPQSTQLSDTGRPKRECTLPKSTPKVEIVVEDAVPSLPVKPIKQKQQKKQKVSKKKRKRKTEVGSESNVELPSSDSTPLGPSASATPIVDVASIVNSAVQSALKVHSTASRDDSAKLVDVLTKLSSEFSSLRNEINLKAKSDVAVDTSTSSRKSGNKKLKRPVQQQESTEEE
eukprot:g49645.t1